MPALQEHVARALADMVQREATLLGGGGVWVFYRLVLRGKSFQDVGEMAGVISRVLGWFRGTLNPCSTRRLPLPRPPTRATPTPLPELVRRLILRIPVSDKWLWYCKLAAVVAGVIGCGALMRCGWRALRGDANGVGDHGADEDGGDDDDGLEEGGEEHHINPPYPLPPLPLPRLRFCPGGGLGSLSYVNYLEHRGLARSDVTDDEGGALLLPLRWCLRLRRPTKDTSLVADSVHAFLDVAVADFLRAHFYDLKFSHFTTNEATLEAFAGCRRVRVVAIKHGLQAGWALAEFALTIAIPYGDQKRESFSVQVRWIAMEKKEGGVKKVAVAVAAPEEATPTLTATWTLTAPLQAPGEEPEMQEKCYNSTVGDEATFLETAKDYFNHFNQFKVMPAQKHWTCVKNYFNEFSVEVRWIAMEKKEGGVKKVAVAVAAPEEATPTLTATWTLTAPLQAPGEEPEMQEKCYNSTVGEEAIFLETAKDYFNQFKVMPAHKQWICVKNYFNQKCGSVFGKQKVEPVVKDETTEVVAKPATAAVEST